HRAADTKPSSVVCGHEWDPPRFPPEVMKTSTATARRNASVRHTQSGGARQEKADLVSVTELSVPLPRSEPWSLPKPAGPNEGRRKRCPAAQPATHHPVGGVDVSCRCLRRSGTFTGIIGQRHMQVAEVRELAGSV